MKSLAGGSILIRGHRFSAKTLIGGNPQLTRSRLALQGCEHFQWYNVTETLKHMSMETVMVSFHRASF